MQKILLPYDELYTAYETEVKRRQQAESDLMGYHEYFDAIKRGEYPKTRPYLRPFEEVLFSRSTTHFSLWGKK